MSRNVNSFNYTSVYNILKGFKPVSTIESSTDNEEVDDVILQSNFIDPERMLIKKDEYNHLSDEAKEIILTIINAPPEFYNLIKTPERALISKTLLLELFSELWYSRLIVQTTFREIEQWVKTL